MKLSRCSLLLALAILPIIAGSRINPNVTEGVRPVINRAATYLDQTHPKPITQADIDAGGGTCIIPDTASDSDWYALSADSTGVLTGDIEIRADQVKLVFNGYTLNGQLNIDANYVTIDMEGGKLYVSDRDGILVQQGTNNIQIMNGTIEATVASGFAILINGAYVDHCSNISINNMVCPNAQVGISLQYTDHFFVQNCTTQSCPFGFSIEFCSNGFVAQCSVMKGSVVGYSIVISNNILLKSCAAIDISHEDTTPIGYNINGIDRVILQECVAENITSTSQIAKGISLSDTDKSIIVDCCINNVSGSYSFGIDIYNATDCLILRNILNNTETGLQITDVSTNQILQNVSTNNTNDFVASVGTIYEQAGYDGNTFLDNIALP